MVDDIADSVAAAPALKTSVHGFHDGMRLGSREFESDVLVQLTGRQVCVLDASSNISAIIGICHCWSLFPVVDSYFRCIRGTPDYVFSLSPCSVRTSSRRAESNGWLVQATAGRGVDIVVNFVERALGLAANIKRPGTPGGRRLESVWYMSMGRLDVD